MQQRKQEVFGVVATCTKLPDAVSKLLVDYSVDAEQAEYQATNNFYLNAVDRYNWMPVPKQYNRFLKQQIDMVGDYLNQLDTRKWSDDWQKMIRVHIRRLQRDINQAIHQHVRRKNDRTPIKGTVALNILSNFNREPNPLIEGTYEEED